MQILVTVKKEIGGSDFGDVWEETKMFDGQEPIWKIMKWADNSKIIALHKIRPKEWSHPNLPYSRK